MKKLLLILVMLAAIAAAAGVALGLSATHLFASERNQRGSGRIVTETIPIPYFDAIEASRSVRVVLTDRPLDKITIEADDNVMRYVSVRTDEETLCIGIDRKLRKINDINVTVTVPYNRRIESLEASGAARIEVEPLVEADEFDIEASSAATIVARVKARSCSLDASSAANLEVTVEASECDIEQSSASKSNLNLTVGSCEIDLSSAANATVAGTADRCEADLSSSAKLSAAAFRVTDYNAAASSAASAEIQCTGWLRARASSGATIHFTGECRTDINMSSGGRVY